MNPVHTFSNLAAFLEPGAAASLIHCVSAAAQRGAPGEWAADFFGPAEYVSDEERQVHVESSAVGVMDDVDARWLYTVRNGVAIVGVSGVIWKRPGYRYGAADLVWLDAALKRAAVDVAVKAILIHWNSPGGSGVGLRETEALVQEIKKEKPVYSYTDTMMGSAAYWVASASTAIFAASSATVGSIGSMIYWRDFSAYYEKAGIRPRLLASGKYKGMFSEGISLTEDQEKLLEDRLEFHAAEFRGVVKRNRPSVQEDTMEGQGFEGAEGVERGLVDVLAPSVEDLVAAIVDGVPVRG